MAAVCEDKYTKRAESLTIKEENMETEGEKEEENQKPQETHQHTWQPNFYLRVDKEIYYFAGHEISIWQSLDSYGATIWPAALALCQYLDTNRGIVNLLDKAVLEIGAGTGLVSIVASLLGAWVTASDLPEVLGNLRSNLARNTRGRCRYAPQIAELSWGHELKQAFPRSVYRYDYVLAADVVYHHDYLAELLVTMRHFCQPGTTLIWSNKVRFKSDLDFLENFKTVFDTTLLADMGDIKIYSATTKECEEPRNLSVMLKQEEEAEQEEEDNIENIKEIDLHQNPAEIETKSSAHLEECKEEIQEMPKEDSSGEQEEDIVENSEENLSTGENDQRQQEGEDEESSLQSEIEEKSAEADNNEKSVYLRTWQPSMYYMPDKEIHYFLGHKISIEESLDSYGAVIWPAAVALCKFLDTAEGQQQINLLDKSVLEIGAGTGLLSIAATLLGAKLTATDLPEILSNLRFNLNRNTRQHRRHEPLVMELSWGHKLEETFPHSTYHYDYVLAADVVYHHSFLAELLETMRHFCQPGTTLIWANKIRYTSDWTFVENFEKSFHATVIAELDQVRIYKATYRTPDEEDNDLPKSVKEEEVDKNQDKNEEKRSALTRNKKEVLKLNNEEDDAEQEAQHQKDFKRICIQENIRDTQDRANENVIFQLKTNDETGSMEEESTEEEDEESEGAEIDEECEFSNESTSTSDASTEDESGFKETNAVSVYQRIWQPSMYYTPGKEIHYFLGHNISIKESLDSYGAVIWPAAVALCKFLDTAEGQQQINLLDKSVLEIGAGTGLLSIVATLLGAKLTATDLPEILSNLRFNLNRNTRQHRRHEPLVMELSWGHKLEETFPHSTYHYDYVLAADVVYHHSFLAELLETMRHFCQPGTTLIWANKIRYTSDWTFIENFEKSFHATVIAELDQVRIYKATYKSAQDDNC
ncbi:uncharacterized protein LOC103046522 [Astyanax mexicanus]|uniref:uncharacterized protein LOC103046522 n=1 Tax=Astyanax mexicanus TaxID=7994 RepID=UPI0020CB1ADC|nr:uncharacterized protein LOC103046522 [Astyanax mexicanus]